MTTERPVLTVERAKAMLPKMLRKLEFPDLTEEERRSLEEVIRLLKLKIRLADNAHGRWIDRMREGERRRARWEQQG